MRIVGTFLFTLTLVAVVFATVSIGVYTSSAIAERLNPSLADQWLAWIPTLVF
jgi:hypothetical protein